MNRAFRYLIGAVSLAGALANTTPALAQQAVPASPGGAQAALLKDLGNLSTKFTGLAQVMAGKYDWRPGPGVRSVSEVFNLIVMENNMLSGLLSGTGGSGGTGGGRGVAITEPAALQEALRSSYANVEKALSALSATDLNTAVRLFGQDTTKQGAVWMLLMDQHEHLGQSIAYARTNGVVPPWSK